MSGQVATGGTGGLWKIYDGRSKKEAISGAPVSVWLLEKRPPAGMRDSQQSESWESLLELCRKYAPLRPWPSAPPPSRTLTPHPASGQHTSCEAPCLTPNCDLTPQGCWLFGEAEAPWSFEAGRAV